MTALRNIVAALALLATPTAAQNLPWPAETWQESQNLTSLDPTDFASDLSGAHLNRAFLFQAYLCEADLREADLNGTNLSKADLSGADLRGVDLSETNLNGANLDGIKYNDRTKWPEGFSPVDTALAK